MKKQKARKWKDRLREKLLPLSGVILSSFVVLTVVLLWWLWPRRLPPFSVSKSWFWYGVGFGFSALVGGWLIKPLLHEMHGKVNAYVRGTNPQYHIGLREIRPFTSFPTICGYIERPLYTASWLIGRPEFIGVWLVVKMAARWTLPKDPLDSRHRYYPVLVGNLLSVLYGVVGAIVIKWLQCSSRFWPALLIMLVLMSGTSGLTLYESYRSKNKGEKRKDKELT